MEIPLHQTYQNYEQSRQKLGTFLENKVCISKIKVFKNIYLLKVGLLIQYSSKHFFILERFDQFSTLKMTENQNFDMFEEVVHNFGKSEGDII